MSNQQNNNSSDTPTLIFTAIAATVIGLVGWWISSAFDAVGRGFNLGG